MPDDSTPDPREEAAVSRLLAQARHDEPIPAEVAARIDDALAALGSEQAPAVASFSRTRRRRATALLLAAAAVVVVGIGIDQLVGPTSSEESVGAASDSAGAAAQDRSRGVDRGADAESAQSGSAESGSAQSGSASGAPADPASPQAGAEGAGDVPVPVDGLRLVADPPRITEERFGRDVRAARREVAADERASLSGSLDGQGSADATSPHPGFACESYVAGRGRAVAVRYAQAPAVLVLRPPTGESQVVDLVSCGDGEIVRSVTLPVR